MNRFVLALAAPMLILATAGSLVVPAAGGPGEETISEAVAAAREVLADESYQTRLPGRIPEPLGFDLDPRWPRFAAVLFFAVIGTAVAISILWAVHAFAPGALDRRPDERPDHEPENDAVEGLLDDPERLAAEGRLDEATHLLLLLAIRRLSAGLQVPPSPASTSRELTSALPLPGARHQAFRELVSQVERSLFGGRSVGPKEFARCRRCFLTLVARA